MNHNVNVTRANIPATNQRNGQDLITSIHRAVKALKSLGPAADIPDLQVSSLCAGRPHMQLAPQGIGPGMVYVSDKIRAEMNEWMREFFGAAPDFVIQATDRHTGKVTVFVSQRDYDKIKPAWVAATQQSPHALKFY